jgi:hypothetical protein
MIGLPDRQWHDHPPIQVPARPAGLLAVKRDWNKRAQYELSDGFAAAGEQCPQAVGDRGEQDIVHRRMVGCARRP